MMKHGIKLATGVILASGVITVAHSRSPADAPLASAGGKDSHPVSEAQWLAVQKSSEALTLGARSTGQSTYAAAQVPAAPGSVDGNELLSQARLNHRVENDISA